MMEWLKNLIGAFNSINSTLLGTLFAGVLTFMICAGTIYLIGARVLTTEGQLTAYAIILAAMLGGAGNAHYQARKQFRDKRETDDKYVAAMQGTGNGSTGTHRAAANAGTGH